ncbi:GTP-binding protein [Thermosipho melanesiensis]|uniref:GTP-binding protein, HSR1-related n=2 Tax=Thermosipho melanesiensis TaxID=46541 RepID=A6LL58_THEM4|nr:ribosome biogenesis GTPase YqeH [Thermosipho melanesiensis]ABR30659.1 GTP-binding protein, HSR1-related [Thermosipho melanesiensis BI429]APT73794.1 GTP-binding protein [Thermosipho melanesiensis]OOC35732.1 GTP-binding protein [Thermosipho melanesiensis]OOC39031.1 GTP-binding protein [Thermosipho melanesiensis]OOC39179.1 GTP-binding protein [Thermosipho melanesiensis]
MKCKGCGVELQTVDPKKPGYVPEHILLEEEEPLCQRCYRIIHYGKLTVPVEEEIFLDKLNKVLKDFNKVIYVVDITDFEGTFRKEIMEKLKNKEVYFAVTKFDLLPSFLSSIEAQEWLKKRLGVSSEYIFLLSSVNKFGLRKIEKFLKNLKEDILILGVTNVGKSSLISHFTDANPTISPFPGTTLGIMKRRIFGINLYDTPGILTHDRIIDLLSPDCQAKILNTKRLTRKTFKIDSTRAVLVSAYCKIEVEYDMGKKPIFQIFTPEKVTFHETKKERADELMRNRAGDLLVPPCKKEKLDFEFVTHEIEVDEEKEVAITGLGFLNVKRGPFLLKITVPKGIRIIKRNRLLKPRRGG